MIGLMSETYFKRANAALLTAIIIINGYIILSPAWPMVHLWWVNHFTGEQQALTAYTNSTSPTPSKPSNKAATPIPKDNRLIIPKIALNDTLVEGQSTWTVNKGVWRWYWGSTPGKGGNTVLIGHRWTYDPNPAGVFYHLDLLKKGDKIAVYWQQKRYLYQVTRTEVVGPNDTRLVQPTKEPTLTMYTCTPMFTSKYRLFVISKLVEGPNA